jgi:hypothetical protein
MTDYNQRSSIAFVPGNKLPGSQKRQVSSRLMNLARGYLPVTADLSAGAYVGEITNEHQ